jgi:hypothetical protein
LSTDRERERREEREGKHYNEIKALAEALNIHLIKIKTPSLVLPRKTTI